MIKHTKEEIKQYYASVRKQWLAAKLLSQRPNCAYRAAWEHALTTGLTVSFTGWVFTAIQMESLGYDGLPYIDCKTFHGWKDMGMAVIRGQKSQITGCTWIPAVRSEKQQTDGDEISNMYPKVYHLFHRSQVLPIEGVTIIERLPELVTA